MVVKTTPGEQPVGVYDRFGNDQRTQNIESHYMRSMEIITE